MDPRLLARRLEAAATSEMHAFEAVHRCCADARMEYRRTCVEVDLRRRSALHAVMAGDVRAAILHTRRAVEAEMIRTDAWIAYREAFDLMVVLVRRTSQQVTRDSGALAATG